MKMHYFFIGMCVFMLACSDTANQAKNISSMPHDQNTTTVDSCKPKDTHIGTGFVKYVSYGSFFGINVGSDIWDTSIGNKYDCAAPQSIIPSYEWSNDSIISLKRGCSNYCTKNYYFILSQRVVIQRDNVIATSTARNLICYFNQGLQDTIGIESLLTHQLKLFPLKNNLACAEPIACIDKAQFRGEFLYLIFRIDHNGEEKSQRLKFRF